MLTFDLLSALDLSATSKVSSPQELTRMPDAEFALIVRHERHPLPIRRLPMATPGLAVTSAAQLQAHRDLLPAPFYEKVAAVLDERLRSFGVEVPLERGSQRVEPRAGFWWSEIEAMLPTPPPTKVSGPRGKPFFVIEVPENPLQEASRTVVQVPLYNAGDLSPVVRTLEKQSGTLPSNVCRALAQGARKAHIDLFGGDGSDLNSGEVQRFTCDVPRDQIYPYLADRREKLSGLEKVDSFNAKLVGGYLSLLDEVQTVDAAEGWALRAVLAEKMSSTLSDLDEALDITPDFPAHVAFFGKHSESDPVVDTRGAILIRKSHLEAIPEVNTQALKNYLADDVMKKLLADPVAAYKNLTPSQQSFVANWVQEHIQIRKGEVLHRAMSAE
jgi:hypothetical protein